MPPMPWSLLSSSAPRLSLRRSPEEAFVPKQYFQGHLHSWDRVVRSKQKEWV